MVYAAKGMSCLASHIDYCRWLDVLTLLFVYIRLAISAPEPKGNPATQPNLPDGLKACVM